MNFAEVSFEFQSTGYAGRIELELYLFCTAGCRMLQSLDSASFSPNNVATLKSDLQHPPLVNSICPGTHEQPKLTRLTNNERINIES
jgi:hypothetical protein